MTARMAVVKNICPCADRYLCAEYPLTGDTLRSVSDDLGFAPIWSVEQDEIYFLYVQGFFIDAVSVQTSSGFSRGEQAQLFPWRDWE